MLILNGVTAGFVASAVASGAALAQYARRVALTEGKPTDFPGPKAWPAFGAVASLFALIAAAEGLRDVGL